MSLLMDALKRAERARQAEAERAKSEGAGEEPTASSELSLDPIEDPADDQGATPAGEPAPSVPPPAPATAGTDTEDSLELTPPEVRREIESMDDPVFGDTGAVDTTGVSPSPGEQPAARDGALSLSMEYGDIPLDETGATLPSMRAAQRSVQDYFDGTHSMSLSMDDMQEALALERDDQGGDSEAGARTSTMDGDTTSRRQAQAVLDARAVAPSNTGRNVALLLFLVLLLGGIGGGAYMFKDRMMAMIDGESDIVIHRRPAAPAPAQQLAQQPAPVVVTRPEQPRVLPAEEREALLRAAEMARAEERRLAEAAAATLARSEQSRAEDTVTGQSRATPATPGASSSPVAASTEGGSESASTGSGLIEQGDDTSTVTPAQRVELAEVMREMNASTRGGIGGGASGGASAGSLSGVKISRRSRPSRTHTALVQAYDAFQRGEDGDAMAAYQGILAREPRNRDAMLGAAAVMMRSGSVEAATRYYAELLRMNPRDGAAQAALIALQEDLDPASGESHVKSLLAHAPEDANLHFTLGNLFAEQGRWPEAQQAYFEAYRLDNANPDFAFNLAVSLDRLVQARAAASYYRRAMELSEQRPAAFESAAAARRLAALGGS